MTASTRYALSIGLASLLTLVPVAIHSYAGLEVDDCRNPSALAPGLDSPDDSWMRQRFQAFAWREKEIRRGGAPLHYVIARSFDAKRLYYRPSHTLSKAGEPAEVILKQVEVGGETLPIFESVYPRALNRLQPRPIAFHLLVYDGELVEEPIREQLLAAPRMLIQGRRPMTLIYVQTFEDEGNTSSRQSAYDWLAETWQTYRAVCS